MTHGEDKLVKVASAGNQAVGEMWREVLESNGIPCLLRVAGPLLAYATFTSQHDLLVAESDAARARELLAAYNEDEGDLSLDRESAIAAADDEAPADAEDDDAGERQPHR
jgi:hypothetical protein